LTTKTWPDVQVGEVLPQLSLPITWKTLALIAAGTRDFMPYHHNSAFTKSVGIRDAFVNTMFNQALFGRFATDWSGPAAYLRSASLRMFDQLCPADTATVSGKVVRSWPDESGEQRVALDLAIRNAMTTTASSTVVLALPSRVGEVLGPRSLEADGHLSADLELIPHPARELIGVKVPRQGAYPVSEAQIMYWCEMVRDLNPRYALDDPDFPDMIAPPTSLLTWLQNRATQTGIDPKAPDVDVPSEAAWPRPATYTRAATLRMPGTTDVIVQEIKAEFGAALRPGDRVLGTSELLHCSPLKRTRLGQGYFVTFLDVVTNDKGQVAGRVESTQLQYTPEASRSQASQM
jgi:hypothetical protein